MCLMSDGYLQDTLLALQLCRTKFSYIHTYMHTYIHIYDIMYILHIHIYEIMIHLKHSHQRTWWYIPIVSVVLRWLSHRIICWSPAWATQWDPDYTINNIPVVSVANDTQPFSHHPSPLPRLCLLFFHLNGWNPHMQLRKSIEFSFPSPCLYAALHKDGCLHKDLPKWPFRVSYSPDWGTEKEPYWLEGGAQSPPSLVGSMESQRPSSGAPDIELGNE